MRRIICCLVVVCGVWAVWADNISTTAAGFGRSRNEAIANAQRKAVEQGLGVLVDSRSITNKMTLVEDRVFARARGFVESYTVESETQDPGGFWQVVLQCVVAKDKLKYTLLELGILRDKMGHPRIIILHDSSSGDWNPSIGCDAAGEAYEGIAEYFTGREFTVMEMREFNPALLKDASSHLSAENSRELGFRKNAEYVLVFNLKMVPGDKLADPFLKKCRVMISAKIINTATGRILANHQQKAMGFDKDSMEFASRKAARNAGKFIAASLEKKITALWVGNSSSGRPVSIIVINTGHISRILAFGNHLKDITGVENLILRNSSENKAEYEILFTGEMEFLSRDIVAVLKKLEFNKINVSVNGDSVRVDF